MANKIVFNDGTEVENGIIAVDFNKQILVVLPGSNLMQAMLLLSDPNKTEKMIYYNDVFKTTYNGFTMVNSISIRQSDNVIDAYMTGDNTSIDTGYTLPDFYLPEALRKGD